MANNSFQCPSCSSKLTVADSLWGKRVACPKCKSPVQLPAAPPESNASASSTDATAATRQKPAAAKSEESLFDLPSTAGTIQPVAHRGFAPTAAPARKQPEPPPKKNYTLAIVGLSIGAVFVLAFVIGVIVLIVVFSGGDEAETASTNGGSSGSGESQQIPVIKPLKFEFPSPDEEGSVYSPFTELEDNQASALLELTKTEKVSAFKSEGNGAMYTFLTVQHDLQGRTIQEFLKEAAPLVVKVFPGYEVYEQYNAYHEPFNMVDILLRKAEDRVVVRLAHTGAQLVLMTAQGDSRMDPRGRDVLLYLGVS